MRFVWRLTFLLAAASSTIDAQVVAAGSRAPEIDLPTLNGGRIRLSKMRGHAVIVSFWGTWCPPCRDEFPELVAVQGKHARDGLYVIAVNGRDQERNTGDVQRFVESFGVTFPIALDKRGIARRRYRIEGQPATVFIDPDGVVRAVHTGLIRREGLDNGIRLILPDLTAAK